MFRTTKQIIATVALMQLGAGDLAMASEEAPCFDVKILARIVDQVPAIVPDPYCGEDCIILLSPWFLDLKVAKILQGELEASDLTVFALLHTRYSKAGKRVSVRWLRRNTVGGFNFLRLSEDDNPVMCPPNTSPMRSFLTPRDGKTLDDERREAEEQDW